MMFDYTALGFHTFDCLGRPVNDIPPGGQTHFIDELTLAVSGAAGSAAIAGAKHGMRVQSVGGIGEDDMGAWVIQKLNGFGVDVMNMQLCPDFVTSSSIVTTRPNGERPALHKKGATGAFYVSDDAIDRVIDTKILHIGGVGLMDAMDHGRTKEIMQAAKENGCITTLDVFASTRSDIRLIEPLLPYTDYFLPSSEEAEALTGLSSYDSVMDKLLSLGANCVILTVGAQGVIYRDSEDAKFSMPAFNIDVVCTCGCGDCFNAGFATGLYLELPPESCVRLAQATSAQTALGLGSQAVVHDLNATLEFMNSTPLKSG